MNKYRNVRSIVSSVSRPLGGHLEVAAAYLCPSVVDNGELPGNGHLAQWSLRWTVKTQWSVNQCSN